MSTRASSRVTPWYVAPKLSPVKCETHGGASGSAVCRGGFPTHFLSEGLLPTPAGSGGGAASPAGAADKLDEPASPSDARFPAVGVVTSSPGTGANSTV